MELKAGQIVALTYGAYSDYCLGGHMRVLKSFNSSLLVEEYLREDKAYNNDERFIAKLIREGYIEDISAEVPEWYIGAYGKLRAE